MNSLSKKFQLWERFYAYGSKMLAQLYYSGRVPGATTLVIFWIITLYTLWQMVYMHEFVPGKCFDRYHEMGQHAFGEKLGLWIVVPQQVICLLGVDTV
ncbi:hypothetical protein ACS0TY_006680 [Phlomoides rotata]